MAARIIGAQSKTKQYRANRFLNSADRLQISRQLPCLELRKQIEQTLNTMLMKTIRLSALLSGLLLVSVAQVDAQTVSLSSARAKASREGKILLVDFTARWCLPCQMMDETTFADEQVLDYLRRNYVSIKIDIDNFDGYSIKQQYEVEALPAMLFFSSDGKELDRIEQAITATDLLLRLRQNDQAQYRKAMPIPAPDHDWTEPFAKMGNVYAEQAELAATKPKPGPAPEEHVLTNDDEPESWAAEWKAPSEATPAGIVVSLEAPTENSTKLLTEQRAVSDHGAPAHLRQDAYAPPTTPRALEAGLSELEQSSQAHRVVNDQGVLVEAAKDEPAAESQEEEFTPPTENPCDAVVESRKSVLTKVYRLQIGVYNKQEYALRAATEMQSRTDKPVDIEVDATTATPVYRVYVGRFTDLADAKEVGNSLQHFGVQCYMRELAMQ